MRPLLEASDAARLFFDRRLSRDGSIACASCHDPGRAYSGGAAVGLLLWREGPRCQQINAPEPSQRTQMYAD
jgi:cytochrome c peroxidase